MRRLRWYKSGDQTWLFFSYKEALIFRLKMAKNRVLGLIIPRYRRAYVKNQIALTIARLVAEDKIPVL